MGQNPKESSRTHSHAHAKGYEFLEIRHGQTQIFIPKPKITRYSPVIVLQCPGLSVQTSVASWHVSLGDRHLSLTEPLAPLLARTKVQSS